MLCLVAKFRAHPRPSREWRQVDRFQLQGWIAPASARAQLSLPLCKRHSPQLRPPRALSWLPSLKKSRRHSQWRITTVGGPVHAGVGFSSLSKFLPTLFLTHQGSSRAMRSRNCWRLSNAMHRVFDPPRRFFPMKIFSKVWAWGLAAQLASRETTASYTAVYGGNTLHLVIACRFEWPRSGPKVSTISRRIDRQRTRPLIEAKRPAGYVAPITDWPSTLCWFTDKRHRRA